MKKVLKQHGLLFTIYYLCYNSKQMLQYGHWKRQRGLANSKSLEIALLAHPGRVPDNMPKCRYYVDPGSALFNQVVRNVPVLAPKNQAYVPRQIREVSLRSMMGVPHNEDEGEKQKTQVLEEENANTGMNQPNPNQTAQDEEKAFVAAHIKKRKLYRQLCGTEVPWFPHDNDPALLKEFCYEAGHPRWVFHGTPAGGAGIHGCFEMGSSVVALCYDEHHREHLEKFLLQRAVESMVSGMSMVFKDSVLQARSAELHLAHTSENSKNDKKRAADKKEKKEHDQDGQAESADKKEKKSKKKETKKRGTKKQGKKSKPESSVSSSASDSDEDSSSSEHIIAKRSKTE